MKKLLTVCIAAVMLMMCCCGSALAAVTVELDGHGIPSDVAPLLKSGRTLVPLRTVSEALGATVMWKDNEASIKTYEGEKMRFTPGRQTAVYEKADGTKQNVKLDVPAVMRDNRVMVPLRVIAETFDVKTDYQNGKVILSSTPVYVDGKALNSMTTHFYMTMGGKVEGYYGNANVGRLYNALAALKGEEVAKPEYYSSMILADMPYFHLVMEFDFYNGQPQLVDGTKTQGLVNWAVYNGVKGWAPDTTDAENAKYQGYRLHDENADKWYSIKEEDYEAFIDLRDQLYPYGVPLREELLNNIA